MIEAGWEHTYPGQDLAVELLQRRRGWRWFRVRFFGLLSRDTSTATLWTQGEAPKGASPQAVGDTLARWAQ